MQPFFDQGITAPGLVLKSKKFIRINTFRKAHAGFWRFIECRTGCIESGFSQQNGMTALYPGPFNNFKSPGLSR